MLKTTPWLAEQSQLKLLDLLTYTYTVYTTNITKNLKVLRLASAGLSFYLDSFDNIEQGRLNGSQTNTRPGAEHHGLFT
jgi:hypothetical protein